MDAVGSIFAGNAQAQQYVSQATVAKQQAKDVDLQALQASGQRREQLRSSLATIQANRAESGMSIDSPTAMAIEGSVKTDASRGEQIQRVGFLNQKQSLLWGAKAAQQGASNAITAGWINGFTSLSNDALKLYEAS